MILHQVTAGDDGAGGQMQGAYLEVIDILAAPALEVIVVPHARAFVAGLPVREDYRPDAFGLDQQIERPVNRCYPQAPERLPGAREDLLDRHGPLGLGNGLEDRIALAGMTLAERGWHAPNLAAGTASAQGKGAGFPLDSTSPPQTQLR